MGNESIEGDERGPYLMLERSQPTECGIAYTSKGAWRQSFHSTRGSDAPPRSAGKRHARGRKAGEPFQTRRELGGREMRKPFLILSAMGRISGKPSALKDARSVWERGVGNVLTTRVRERRVSFQSLSPALLETRQRASFLFHDCFFAIAKENRYTG